MSDEKDVFSEYPRDPELEKKLPNYKEIETAFELLVKGASVGDLLGFTPEKIEMLYAVAYSLYNSGKYEQALKLFRGLCLYESTDVRFWMGMGGCQDNLKKYEEAARSYVMGSAMSGFDDPEPLYYAALCFLKDGKKSQAIEVFESIAMTGREGNAHDLDFKERSKKLLETIKSEA